jgi:hypothetical protein
MFFLLEYSEALKAYPIMHVQPSRLSDFEKSPMYKRVIFQADSAEAIIARIVVLTIKARSEVFNVHADQVN